jgi:glutaredoxin
MTVTLYALDGCPHCERVEGVLDENDVEYEIQWVEPEFSKRDEVRELSNQRGVPVLEDDERSVVMANTDRIVEYVETTLA